MFKNFSKLKNKHKAIFAIIIIFAVVAFWRGTRGLLDVYLFSSNYELSSWISIIIGLIILKVAHYTYKGLL